MLIILLVSHYQKDKVRVRVREKEREREIFKSVVCSPNAHNSQVWARPNSRARNCTQITHFSGRNLSTRVLTGSWTGSGVARI